jgi:hypothetical protein
MHPNIQRCGCIKRLEDSKGRDVVRLVGGIAQVVGFALEDPSSSYTWQLCLSIVTRLYDGESNRQHLSISLSCRK